MDLCMFVTKATTEYKCFELNIVIIIHTYYYGNIIVIFGISITSAQGTYVFLMLDFVFCLPK